MLTGKIISAFEKCLLFVSFIEILSHVGKPSTPSFFLDQSPFVKHFGKTVNCGKLIIKNWSETQKLTITQQLMSGVRYLDMRVAYLKEEDDFRFAHGLHGSKLTTLLEEVRIFIKSHPKEVIFIEFKNFIGLTKTLHGRFASIILSKFSGKIQPWFHGNNVTLSKMWATGKRLIIIYKDIAKIPFNTIFYQPSQVSSDWANTDSADALLKALGNQYEKRNSSIINVYQAVLAPQAITIIENPLGSLEEDLARKANIKVRKWLKTMYYQNLTGLNIIILDYVGYGNCIEQILKLNSLLSNF